MTDHRVFVRPHLVIEILLGGEEFQRAGLAAGEPFVGRVADLLGHRDDLFSEFGDGDQALLELEDRVQDVVLHHSLGARHLDFGLSDVDLGPRDVALIAVVQGDGQRCAQGPGVGAGHTKVCVVLKGIRLIKDVGVRVGVRLGQLEIGLGSPQAVLVGDQVRPFGDSPLDQLFLGNGKFPQLADGVEHVDLLDVVERHVQNERQRPIRRRSWPSSTP